jgi:phosphate-selective porin
MGRCHSFAVVALTIVGLTSDAARPATSCGGEFPQTIPTSLGSLPPALPDDLLARVQPIWQPAGESKSAYTLRLRGRIDTDSIWSHQSPANTNTFGDLQDVVGLRRARIGVEGELDSYGRYVAEIDLASGFVVPRDVYAALGQRQNSVEAQVGHFREPFSLEGGTSARHFAFMERSPVNLLDPARNWGVGLFHEQPDSNSSVAIGAFYAGTDAGDFQGGDGSTVGLTSRLTTAPINQRNGEQLLHFGIALSERSDYHQPTAELAAAGTWGLVELSIRTGHSNSSHFPAVGESAVCGRKRPPVGSGRMVWLIDRSDWRRAGLFPWLPC